MLDLQDEKKKKMFAASLLPPPVLQELEQQLLFIFRIEVTQPPPCPLCLSANEAGSLHCLRMSVKMLHGSFLGKTKMTNLI